MVALLESQSLPCGAVRDRLGPESSWVDSGVPENDGAASTGQDSGEQALEEIASELKLSILEADPLRRNTDQSIRYADEGVLGGPQASGDAV